MFVYGAILPHPPFVIEGLRHDRREELEDTIAAMKSVGEDILSLDVDTIVLITTHGERYNKALGIAFHDPYVASLHEFGDLREKVTYAPDMKLADRLKRAVRHSDFHATMTTNDTLDHASSVPLVFLQEYFQGKKVVVLTPPVDDSKLLDKLGGVLRQAIEDVDERVAVLAVAELSSRLSEVSPGGVHPQAALFDEGIRTALKDASSMPILKATDEELEDLGAEELDAIRLFWGMLDEKEHRMEERAYEYPFGIGHLTMVANLH